MDLVTPGGPPGCNEAGRYRFRIESTRLTFELVFDDCALRRMIFDRSSWHPEGEAEPAPERRIVRTVTNDPVVLPDAGSFGGQLAVVPGAAGVGHCRRPESPRPVGRQEGREHSLAHVRFPASRIRAPSSGIDRIFVTSAISTDTKATFRPGLYGDGDASNDLSRHRWMIYAIDTRTGKMLWERVAFEGEPVDKRHIKSTYASSTPATDGRIVVASFGSQGVYAYDVDGHFLWKVDLGRLDLGAYEIPTFEWGPASSPIIWNGLVILQCDTQADSFLLALNAETGETVWKTGARRASVVGHADRCADAVRAGARDQRGQLHSRVRPAHREGAVAARRQLEDHRADADLRRWPVRRGQRPRARSGRSSSCGPAPAAISRCAAADTSSDAIVWSRASRGPYMPTPLVYGGLLYVLANNGIFDAYDLRTGDGSLSSRLPEIGSGFSASPVAADGKIYLSNEDGEMHRRLGRQGVQTHRDEPNGRAADGDAGAVGWRHVRAVVAKPVRSRAEALAYPGCRADPENPTWQIRRKSSSMSRGRVTPRCWQIFSSCTCTISVRRSLSWSSGPMGALVTTTCPLYWSEPERRFPFLVRHGTRVVGFVLATRGSPASDDPDVFDVAEFFVIRRHRRSGVGRRAAFLVWDRLPGRWIVRVSEGNTGALPFWASVDRGVHEGHRNRVRTSGQPERLARVFF